MDKVREFLKANDWMNPEAIESDQKKGLPTPSSFKNPEKNAEIIKLPSPKNLGLGNMPLIEAITKRRSYRNFTSTPISLDELSFLLWATQGVQKDKKIRQNYARNVASGGNKHSFETYLVVFRVKGLENGLYRFLPLEHELEALDGSKVSKEKVVDAYNGRKFIGEAAVVFIWSTIPYRTYYTYGSTTPKIIAQDSGHLCQNLYLACTSIGLGNCAIGAYHQDKMDELISVDGLEEFVVYVSPVGRI